MKAESSPDTTQPLGAPRSAVLASLWGAINHFRKKKPLPLCRAYPIVGTVVHFSINYLCKKKKRTYPYSSPTTRVPHRVVYNFREMGDRAKNVKSKSPIALRFEGFPLTGSSCAEPLAP